MRAIPILCQAAAMMVLLALGATTEARVSHGYSTVFTLDTVTDAGHENLDMPRNVELSPAYPNPFNPNATIEFELTDSGSIDLSVYDPQGRLVQSLASGAHSVGRHAAAWDGRDMSGRFMPSGIYFCRLRSPWGTQTKKLTLVR